MASIMAAQPIDPLQTDPANRYVLGVFWLRKPPYLRWAGAGLIVVAALLWDLREGATEPHPFASRDLVAGEAIEADDIEWRDLPGGVLTAPDPEGTTAAVPIARGEPLTRPVLTRDVGYPDDWWAVPVVVSAAAVPGSAVRLVILEPPMTVDGVVAQPGTDDPFSLDPTGLVAVPAEVAAQVAAAAIDGNLVVLARP
jgi:hypothetical protein